MPMPPSECTMVHITRIEEYLDSGKRAAIKAAREAMSG
jgi:hypothetical protein